MGAGKYKNSVSAGLSLYDVVELPYSYSCQHTFIFTAFLNFTDCVRLCKVLS